MFYVKNTVFFFKVCEAILELSLFGKVQHQRQKQVLFNLQKYIFFSKLAPTKKITKPPALNIINHIRISFYLPTNQHLQAINQNHTIIFLDILFKENKYAQAAH